jgi:hypothetical protein
MDICFCNTARPPPSLDKKTRDEFYFATLPVIKRVARALNTSCPPRRSCVRRIRRPPAAVENSNPDIIPAEFHLPNPGNCLNNRGYLCHLCRTSLSQMASTQSATIAKMSRAIFARRVVCRSRKPSNSRCPLGFGGNFWGRRFRSSGPPRAARLLQGNVRFPSPSTRRSNIDSEIPTV